MFHHGPLLVEETEDEHGQPRFFITDGLTGDWLGEPFPTREEALAEITRMHELPQED